MKRIPARILDTHLVSPTVIELVLDRGDRKPFFDFQPGQYATLSFPQNPWIRGERSFSITSAPTDRSTLHFGIRIHGRYTSALRDLQPGEPVMVAGPYGQFTFQPERDQSAVFLAGGIGVTPFLSMIHAATDEQLENDLLLIYSVRSLDDAPFAKELDALERANPHFRVIYAVTDERVPANATRMIPGRITKELVEWAVGKAPFGRSYFLCGPQPFMNSMSEVLREIGIETNEVRTERFAVGSPDLIERATPVPKLVFAAWGLAAAIVLGVVVRTEQGRRAIAGTTTSPVPIERTTATLPDQNAPIVSPNTGNIGDSSNSTPTSVPATPSVVAPSTPRQVVPVVPSTPSYRMIVPRTSMS